MRWQIRCRLSSKIPFGGLESTFADFLSGFIARWYYFWRRYEAIFSIAKRFHLQIRWCPLKCRFDDFWVTADSSSSKTLGVHLITSWVYWDTLCSPASGFGDPNPPPTSQSHRTCPLKMPSTVWVLKNLDFRTKSDVKKNWSNEILNKSHKTSYGYSIIEKTDGLSAESLWVLQIAACPLKRETQQIMEVILKTAKAYQNGSQTDTRAMWDTIHAGKC